jgi:hypothetical protein
MICAVCMAQVSAATGVVETHESSPGQICPMSGKPPFVWTERTCRPAVEGRSGGLCELACGNAATNMHHRKNVSQGGLWTPANVMHLCGSGTTGCHGYFTHHRTEAYALGVAVRRSDNPADIPVRTLALDLLHLTDDIAPPLPGWLR